MTKVFVKVDENNCILELTSIDANGYILVDEGEGPRFIHVPTTYIGSPLTDGKGIPLYQLYNKKIVKRKQEDIKEEHDAVTESQNKESEQYLLSELSKSQSIRAASILFISAAENEEIDNITISEYPNLFVTWTPSWTGKRSSIVNDGNVLYKAIHDVLVPEQNQKPSEDKTNQLWKQISNPNDEWPLWSQPISGVDNPYMTGNKVTYNEFRWISSIDNNVWEPGKYGWEKQ